MTPGDIIRMTPSPAERVALEYCSVIPAASGPQERIAIWQEHCERNHRAENRGWLCVLAVLAIVAAFFAGFATCAVELVK